MTGDHGSRGDFTITTRTVPIALGAIGLGLVSTGVADALLKLIALCTNLFFFQRWSTAPASPADHHLGAVVVLVPVAGALLVGGMARFGSERIRGHGIPEAIEAILLRGSRVEPLVALLKPISAAIAIGSGGPFGAEGPIIMTGGAVGSMVAQAFHLTAAERKTLLVAGAAAGMSAVFGTPCAATLLAVELLLFEWKPRSVIPVALASATAAVARPLILDAGPLFPVPPHTHALGFDGFLGCIVCGLLAGALAAALTHALYAVEDGFAKLPIHWMWWPAIGAVAVGVGGWLDPRALGVGYDNIAGLLTGSMVGAGVVGFALVKGGAWAIALGSGTSGGVLAPLLTLGAALGAIESGFLPEEGVGFWPLVSMGAILGGTMRSPLTAVVFALELTHDFGTMLPLLIAVSAAYLFTALALPRSILTEKIARRGFHLSREYAVDPLEILFVAEVMRNAVAVPDTASRDEALGILDAAPVQAIVPVVGPEGRVTGVIRRAELAAAPSTARVGTLARPAITATVDDILREVAYRMAETGHLCLPVVDEAGALVGLVDLEGLLQARVRHLDEERRRERSIDLRGRAAAWLR
jgi:CIC family chloride channel protein